MGYIANSGGRMSKMGCQESASKADRSREDLFKIVCYSPHRKACDDAIQGIEQLSPKLASYVAKHVKPLLTRFARAYLGDVFTKGYNTTSPAESHNNIIKNMVIDGRFYTLRGAFVRG